MNIYERFSKILKLHKWFNSNKGFTLIEAIVTVAIVGAVITPIALIFQGALNSSVLTRDQLKVTQLTQQYVEALETLDITTIKDLVDDDGGIIDSTTALKYGLPPLIDGTDVVVDLHYAAKRGEVTDPEYNVEFDTPDYQVVALTGKTLQVMNYDMLLHLNSSANNNIKIYTRINTYASGTPKETFAGSNTDRHIKIRYEDVTATGSRKVTLYRGAEDSVVSYPIIGNDSANNTIIVYCDDELTPLTSQKATYIEVENLTSDQVYLLVFESVSDTIEPIISILNGSVSVSRGLSEIDTSVLTHRIFEVEVTVTKGSVSDHIVTTVLAK